MRRVSPASSSSSRWPSAKGCFFVADDHDFLERRCEQAQQDKQAAHRAHDAGYADDTEPDALAVVDLRVTQWRVAISASA